MNYQVTARKYRPQTFADVIGQKHVTVTLMNALKSGRIGQSYLFSGPRGVGKTTLARILVKGLNCEKGPTIEPCNNCEHCSGVNEARSMDYTEIDGASNRGIDQIRELNDSLKYASPNQKYRVFVIDEVHMLTIEAFNALLKSLEEPPAKVIFVFCTTEPHKVPATIRSRCQHYQFKSFPVDEMAAKLKSVCEIEKISFEESALYAVARAASGSMRDSQNLFDQVASLGNGNVTLDAALEVLGLHPFSTFHDFLEFIKAADVKGAHSLFLKVLSQGREMRQFAYGLIQVLHQLTLIGEGIEDPALLEVSAAEYSQLALLQKGFSRRDLFLLGDLCFDFIKELRSTSEEKTTAMIHLLKFVRLHELVTPEEIKAELLELAGGLEKEEEAKEVKPQAAAGNLTAVDVNAALERLSREDEQIGTFLRKYEFSACREGVLTLKTSSPALPSPSLQMKAASELVKRLGQNLRVDFIQDGPQAAAETGVEAAKKIFKGRVIESSTQGETKI